jgi:mannose-1-phosphate guanylyltransferase
MLSLFDVGQTVFNTLKEEAFLAEQYPKAENISIDYAILEQAKNITMIKASFLWNDLGTWSSLHEQLAQDTRDNVAVKAHLIAREARGNMIYSSSEKLVVVKGLEDFVVVDEDGVLLIYPKGEDQAVKDLRTQAKDQFGDEIA